MSGVLLLFIVVICRSQFDLYLRSFSSTDSTFSASIMYSFLLWSKSVYPAVLLNKSSRLISIFFYNFFFLRVKISLLYKVVGQPAQYILLFLKISGINLVYSVI